MKSLETVSNLINCLSNDEDLRQDLWVHYLSEKNAQSIESHLAKIVKEYQDDTMLQESLWQLIKNPISEKLAHFIEVNFTDYERSIICYLMLGLSASKISEIKGISEVRIRQSIAVIRYNTCWKQIYGTEEKVNG